jgi:ribosomal protein S18 acetylase RimI-like enzyme
MVSLFGRETEPAVLALLTESQRHRGVLEARDLAPAMAAEYASNELYGLWGYEDEDSIIGLAGIEWSEEGRVRLVDLAVAEERRRQGIGRELVRHLQVTLDPRAIAGVTLEAAVPFFRATGFRVEAFGELPTGETRYRFLWAKR